MFPLSYMLASFIRVGRLKVIDADGRTHVFAGTPGPSVTIRLTDRSLYRKLFFNPELHAGEAYTDGRLRFEDSTLRDFLTLFSIKSALTWLLSVAKGVACPIALPKALSTGQPHRPGTEERRPSL